MSPSFFLFFNKLEIQEEKIKKKKKKVIHTGEIEKKLWFQRHSCHNCWSLGSSTPLQPIDAIVISYLPLCWHPSLTALHILIYLCCLWMPRREHGNHSSALKHDTQLASNPIVTAGNWACKLKFLWSILYPRLTGCLAASFLLGFWGTSAIHFLLWYYSVFLYHEW